MIRFERFTEEAQEVPQRAADIMQRYGHNQIDVEHILLALLEQPDGTIQKILKILNVSTDGLIEQLDASLRASPKAKTISGSKEKIFITARVKRIIELSNEEASRVKDKYISSEHLFLSILTERRTPAARILEIGGVSHTGVLTAIEDLRGNNRLTEK